MLKCPPSSSSLNAYLIYVIVFVSLFYESDSSFLRSQLNATREVGLIVRGIYFREETYLKIVQLSTSISHNSLVTIQ